MLPYQPREIEYIVFVISDAFKIGDSKDFQQAVSILKYRLDNRIWGLYSRTRCRRYIECGTKIIFYISGLGNFSKHFTASAESISKPQIFHDSDLPYYNNENEWSTQNPTFRVELKNVNWFKKPVPIKEIMKDLDLFSGKSIKNWGIYLQGGAIRISEEDFKLILRYSS